MSAPARNLQGLGIVEPMPAQLTSHDLYGTFPDAPPSLAGEQPNRVTCLGRLVHGFPTKIAPNLNYNPTKPQPNGPSFKFHNFKGNPPFLPDGTRMGDLRWDRAFNIADTNIHNWYSTYEGYHRDEYTLLKGEDRGMGITRQEAIENLVDKGVLAEDYVDDVADH